MATLVGKSALATVREACEFLHVSRTTLIHMIEAGQLRYADLGVRSRRIPWAQLFAIADAERDTEETQ
jgi:excisionase family DNA binding protein